MNCINCGAPPSRGKRNCAYCQTPLEKVEPRAHRGEFIHALKALQSCDFDYARVRSTQALSKLGFLFTAGQVRRLAECCDFDNARNDVMKLLIPCTTNPGGLLAVVDIFDFDNARTDFLEDLVRAGVRVSPGTAPTDAEGVEEEIEEAYLRLVESPPASGWFRFGVVALSLAFIWLLLHGPLS